jgi:hypothetical protein
MKPAPLTLMLLGAEPAVALAGARELIEGLGLAAGGGVGGGGDIDAPPPPHDESVQATTKANRQRTGFLRQIGDNSLDMRPQPQNGKGRNIKAE